MKNLNYLQMLGRVALALGIIAAAHPLVAETEPIGMATANGTFQLNRSAVWNTATLFDGATIETRAAASELKLNSGVRLRLAAGSRATVYHDRMILDSGFGQMESGTKYEIGARSLHISAQKDALARVRLDGDRKVTVAAIRGSLQVANAAGLLVAEVQAGNSLDFEPQEAGATAPTRASGCLLVKSGKLILADQTTNVVLEVHGPDLGAQVGNRVEIAGLPETQAPSVAGASQMIKVAGFSRIAQGGCTAIAKKLGAATAIAAGGATAAGAASTGTAAGAAGTAAGAGAAAGTAATAAGIGVGTVAVIGGVAAAATVGGLAAVGSLPGQSETPPPASR